MMTMLYSIFAKLALILVVWWSVTSLPPRFIKTCNGDTCDTLTQMVLTVALPVGAIVLVVVIAMIWSRKSALGALQELGAGRTDAATLVITVALLLPVIAFFPLLHLFTGAPLSLRSNWPWMALSVALYNGVNEELMFRGLIFQRLREGRTFRRAATYSAIYFSVAHLPLLLFLGPVIGSIGILLAFPISYPTAYLFERGRNTIWGSALHHAVTDFLPGAIVVGGALTEMAIPLYLVVSLVVAAGFAVWVCLQRRAATSRGFAFAAGAA
jgi:membrane protease YdiL (CAAX protease family)